MLPFEVSLKEIPSLPLYQLSLIFGRVFMNISWQNLDLYFWNYLVLIQMWKIAVFTFILPNKAELFCMHIPKMSYLISVVFILSHWGPWRKVKQRILCEFYFFFFLNPISFLHNLQFMFTFENVHFCLQGRYTSGCYAESILWIPREGCVKLATRPW